MIPQFDMSEVLPPFIGSDPTLPANMSPYPTQMTEVVQQFCTSPDRKAILEGLLQYRADLMSAGITSGFQWLDGSFMENIEVSESRPPNDVDVVTFYFPPVPSFAQWQAWFGTHGYLFDPDQTKIRYKCDAYAVDFRLGPEYVVERTRYWFGLFSHRRNSGLWKGMVQVSLDSADDTNALALLRGLTP